MQTGFRRFGKTVIVDPERGYITKSDVEEYSYGLLEFLDREFMDDRTTARTDLEVDADTWNVVLDAGRLGQIDNEDMDNAVANLWLGLLNQVKHNSDTPH